MNLSVKYGLLLSLITLLSVSCQTVRVHIISRDISKELRKSPVFKNQFTGFSLYDLERKTYLTHYNDHLYFTPASNTKILTAFACMQVLEDSIFTYLYTESADTLFIKPLGDPTFLHPNFPDQPAFELLKNKSIIIQKPNSEIRHFGPGWAWDDYPYSFQPELSRLPLYGNCVRVFKEDSIHIIPDFFKAYTDLKIGQKSGNLAYRDHDFNLFRIWIPGDTSTFERLIPFRTSNELTLELLNDTINQSIAYSETPVIYDHRSMGRPLSPTLALMMKRSDNFLAEQLLIQCALRQNWNSTDELRSVLTKKWMSFLPDELIWKDGSGLSRYNLLTPRSLVAVLNEMYTLKGMDYIKTIFPIGGESGTLKEWYKSSNGEPYIIAKTGTLKNVHCLSGFLITKSGKVLSFSLMNNNYNLPLTDIKKEMERFLLSIHEAY